MATALKSVPALNSMAGALSHLGSSRQRFVNLVSPSLCGMFGELRKFITFKVSHKLDAAIQRLAPSLTPHKGCTIIDINPGAGLWASKLHQYLKPRSHILIEPLKDIYLPWLMPLVEAPGSHYHLRDWDEQTCSEPTQYISEGLLPKDLGTAGSSKTCNNALLIVINLAGTHSPKRQKPLFLAKKLFHSMLEMRSNGGFHAQGPVRMLVLIPASLRTALLPKTVTSRARLSLQMEMICHIEEIIQYGESAREKERKRPGLLDIESSVRVLREMAEKNIHIPDLRRNEIHKRAQEYLQDCGATHPTELDNVPGMRSITPRGWHREMKQLENDFRDGKFSQFVPGSMCTQPGSDAPKKISSRSRYTAEYSRLAELQRNMRHINKNELTVEDLIQEQGVIDSLELDTLSGDLDVLERETKLQTLKSLNERLKTRLEQLSARVRAQFVHYMDDRRALAQDPPLLMWDRRTAEPLIAHENEVHPMRSFSLLDIRPHPPDLYPMTSQQAFEFDMIMKVLFQGTHLTLSALDSLAPGAFNAIVPKVPVLRDPRRGGRRDVSLLKTQLLTREMAYGITLAWDEWPHKPTFGQLIGMEE